MPQPDETTTAACDAEQIATLANLVGRLAFLVQNEIGDVHSTEIQREADAIRDALAEERL